jgi:hypothetical protein
MNIHYLQNNSYEKLLELHSKTLDDLETPQARKFSSQLLNFIKEQQQVCKEDEKILHSSQIIESLFGKLKFLEKEQSRSSFTSLILSVAAMVSKTTNDMVQTAMETVSNFQINQWFSQKIPITAQAQRAELHKLN